MTDPLTALNLYVVPCGAAKTTQPAPARDLYTGAHFRYVLERVIAEAAADTAETGARTRVMILSAMHGLVDLDTILDPYDVTMRDQRSVASKVVAEQLRAIADGNGLDVYAAVPTAYYTRLNGGARVLNDEDDTAPGVLPRLVNVFDVYEAAPGIGYQRGVVATIGK